MRKQRWQVLAINWTWPWGPELLILASHLAWWWSEGGRGNQLAAFSLEPSPCFWATLPRTAQLVCV